MLELNNGYWKILEKQSRIKEDLHYDEITFDENIEGILTGREVLDSLEFYRDLSVGFSLHDYPKDYVLLDHEDLVHVVDLSTFSNDPHKSIKKKVNDDFIVESLQDSLSGLVVIYGYLSENIFKVAFYIKDYNIITDKSQIESLINGSNYSQKYEYQEQSEDGNISFSSLREYSYSEFKKDMVVKCME